MVGITTLKLVTAEVAGAFTSIAKIAEGGIDLTDLPEGWHLLTQVKQLGEDFNLEALKAEVADADKAEQLELYDVFKANFHLDDGTLENTLEQGLLVLFDGAQAILSVLSFAKKVKTA